MKTIRHIIFTIVIISMAIGCSTSKNFTQAHYKENEAAIQSLKDRFRSQYNRQPFSLEVKGKSFQQVGLEIIQDSIRYIYSFDATDPMLEDTLSKYRFDVQLVKGLIQDMQKSSCTWLTNLDYYENLEKKFLVFLSIRHKKLESLFKKDKYFTLAFFDFPQPFDQKQRLLDRKDRKRLRKINGAVLYRINDKVAYALTKDFR